MTKKCIAFCCESRNRIRNKIRALCSHFSLWNINNNRRYDDQNAQYRLNCVYRNCWHYTVPSKSTSSPHTHDTTISTFLSSRSKHKHTAQRVKHSVLFSSRERVNGMKQQRAFIRTLLSTRYIIQKRMNETNRHGRCKGQYAATFLFEGDFSKFLIFKWISSI